MPASHLAHWFPSFSSKLPDLCASFHLKAFGRPIPPRHLPQPPTGKNPRKPITTRAKPSSLALASIGQEPPRPQLPSRPPSDHTSSRRQSESENGESMRTEKMHRSRSRSIDPTGTRTESLQQARPLIRAPSGPLIRAPSGKDLFRGREVGLLRRTSSMMVKKENQGVETQKLGLLGRKTSDPIKARRNSSEAESRARPKSQQAEQNNAIIFATPSKPRLANSIYGSRTSGHFHHPTPIQEEPSSGERPRPTFIAETPVHPGRISNVPLSALRSVDEDDDDEGALGRLMVMTDEEDENEESDLRKVPETPAR